MEDGVRPQRENVAQLNDKEVTRIGDIKKAPREERLSLRRTDHTFFLVRSVD